MAVKTRFWVSTIFLDQAKGLLGHMTTQVALVMVQLLTSIWTGMGWKYRGVKGEVREREIS